MDKAAGEASQSNISLTSARQAFNGSQPGYLTAEMSAWYLSNVAGARISAIGQIASALEGDVVGDGSVKSIFLEGARDKARSHHLSRSITQAQQFIDRTLPILQDFQDRRQSFETMRAQIGKEPVRTNYLLYGLGLFLVVMLEAFINFESFMRVPYITSPFLATGATMAVGCGVGLAAHLHGTIFRQWNFLFSPSAVSDAEHKSKVSDAVKRLVVGGVLLSIALGMVAGSRYYYLRDVITQAIVLGGPRPSMFGGISFMLLGNIVAYGIGSLIAYFMHDPNPIYAEQDRELRKVSKKRAALERQRETARTLLKTGLDNEIQSIVNQDNSARGPNYAELRSRVDSLLTKDQEVLGVLQSYRGRLVGEIAAKGARTTFRLPEGAHDQLLPMLLDRTLSAEEYVSLPLTLGCALGDN
ncbi:MAG: hypothetical protein O9296_11705 [Novosphingobium sp.]|nr:hypothetical protein [Novosphingobium sp.]